jgi:uncharacterized membrane protein YoaK (UPF0700 family)
VQHLPVWASLCAGALFGGLAAWPMWQMSALYVPTAIYIIYLIWFAYRQSPKRQGRDRSRPL